MEFYHQTVLLRETVDALAVRPGGIYVDCTAGGGGHSAQILSRQEDCRLIAIDRDPDAISYLQKRFRDEKRITIIREEFKNIRFVLSSLSIDRVDGIVADLGISSHHVDDPSRGFSFHADAPLDMRMSKEGVSAADLVNTLSEKELTDILFHFGEEKYARSIARNIVKSRANQPITTTLELAELVKHSVPQKASRHSHPAQKTFQALRIAVNGELDDLDGALQAMFDSLTVGGRLAVITFHSLEDRIVKSRFADFCKGCTCPPDFPVCVCGKTPRGRLPFRSIVPSEEEIKENRRARSARLRAVEKVKE